MTKKKNEIEEDFFEAVTRVLNSAANDGQMSVGRAIRTAIDTPAKSYYVTREYAFRELHRRAQRRGAVRRDRRRDGLWEELAEALRRRKERRPREGDWEAIDWVLANCHPERFYISERYGAKVYYKVLGGRRG